MKYSEKKETNEFNSLTDMVREYETSLNAYRIKAVATKIAAIPRDAGTLLGEQAKEGTPFTFRLGEDPVRVKIDTPIEGVQEAMDDGVAMVARFNTPTDGYKCFAMAPTAKEPLLRCAGLLCPTLAGQTNKARDELSPEFVSLVFNEATRKYKGDPSTASIGETPDMACFTAIVQDGQLRYAGRTYKYVPISEALEVAKNSVGAEFPKAEFVNGEFSHEGCTAVWDLGEETAKEYLDLLPEKVKTGLLEGAKVLFQFDTSNVSESGIRLTPRLMLKGKVSIPAGTPVNVPHKGDDPLKRFTEQAAKIGKAFSDMPEEFKRLEETEISNPESCLIKLYESIGRKSIKWVEKAKEFASYYPYECSALDILCEVLDALKDEIAERDLSLSQAADLCDAAARRVMNPNFKKQYDVDTALEKEGIVPEAVEEEPTAA